MTELERRRILIVGAASGMGAAFAELARRRGARVFTADRRMGPGVDREVDVADDDSSRAAVAAAIAELGGLDGLVSTAGVAEFGPVSQLHADTYLRCYGINVGGIATLARHALPALSAGGAGSIVTVASAIGALPYAASAAYGASKAALIHWSKVAAHELGSVGVRVNCVCPGPIDTPMLRDGAPTGMPVEDWLDKTGAMTALGRVGTATEVAEAISFLSSTRAAYITGAVLHVDGGESVNAGR